MKAYSTDLRERVVRAAEEDRPRKEIIHLFGVSRATILILVSPRRPKAVASVSNACQWAASTCGVSS